MEPTIPAGSFILGSRIYRNLEVGDIIIFEKDGQYLVKRIAGCPGDVIDLNEITFMETIPEPNRGIDCLQVGENCYYVLGDNIRNSLDSRYWNDPLIPSTSIIAVIP